MTMFRRPTTSNQIHLHSKHIFQVSVQVHDLPSHWTFQFHQNVHITRWGIFTPGPGAKNSNAPDPVLLI